MADRRRLPKKSLITKKERSIHIKKRKSEEVNHHEDPNPDNETDAGSSFSDDLKKEGKKKKGFVERFVDDGPSFFDIRRQQGKEEIKITNVRPSYSKEKNVILCHVCGYKIDCLFCMRCLKAA